MQRFSLLPRRLSATAALLLLSQLLNVSTPMQAHAQTAQAGGQTATTPMTAAQPAERNPLRPLAYRSIGPHRGGRVTAVAGITSQPFVYYFGATGGGVWKTTDGGVSWEPVSDAFFKTGSVGAIGVAESDPNVVYVGMGESPIRGNVSHGDGMYKTTDAGKTWKKIGLDDTRHIARVRVHPRNPDLVYAAALGHTFGPNEQRGVYRSKDGGKTWERVLYRGPKAGAIDLVLDPTNANIIYAGFWEVIRRPWSLESGGPGGGLFKSTDGGDTWTELTRAPGMPRGLVGKIGVAVSPANPERVWAIVEAEDGGVFRSDNGGRTWTKTNEQRNLRQRAWYYTRIYADTQNPESVYVLNVGFFKSNDGGRNFNQIGVPHGDNHDLWIAPNDAARMVEGNDGGANVSFNGGRTWTEQDQATAQFYRVALDNDFPYHVYGAQQDNSTIKIASRTNDFGIGESDWYDVGGGESGWIAPSPKDSNIVYAGSYGGYLTRYDHRTKQLRSVNVWPENPMGYGAEGMKYRFQWNYPILFSPHDPNTLYAAGDHLFRSTNEGQTWEAISPDLTRNDKSKQGSSGGPITKDNTSVEYYDTIFTVAESPVQKGVIWAGTDDGLVQVTRDAGKTWSNVTPRGIPEWIQINSVEASPHEAGAAYVAATMYKWDDFRPYLYKTTDFGKSWKKIDTGIPDGAFTRVIREDTARRGLLYAGTETGMYVSFDDGERWQPLQLNLPVVPITDLAVHKRERDLVVATQGRSFWILDDLSVLQQLTDAMRAGQGEAVSAQARRRLPLSGRRRPAAPADRDHRCEPDARRRRLLLPQVEADDRRDARIPRPHGQVRPQVHRQGPARAEPDPDADGRSRGPAGDFHRARLSSSHDAAPTTRRAFRRRVLHLRRRGRGSRRPTPRHGGGAQPLRLGHAPCGSRALPRPHPLVGRDARPARRPRHVSSPAHGGREDLNAALRNPARPAHPDDAGRVCQAVHFALEDTRQAHRDAQRYHPDSRGAPTGGRPPQAHRRTARSQARRRRRQGSERQADGD